MTYSDSEIDNHYEITFKKLKDIDSGIAQEGTNSTQILIDLWESPQCLQKFTEMGIPDTCQLMSDKLKRKLSPLNTQ